MDFGVHFILLLALIANKALSISIGDDQYMGCYTDDDRHTALPHRCEDGDKSVSSCIQACRDKQEPYAGLMNGGDCWCGEEYNKHSSSLKCYTFGFKRCPQDHFNSCGISLTNTVYKVCPINKYGSSCENACPTKCLTRGCNMKGECLNSCPPGHKKFENDCSGACSTGYFGPDCSESCPTGCANNNCHPRLGYCVDGCKDEKQGPFCTIEKGSCIGRCATTGSQDVRFPFYYYWDKKNHTKCTEANSNQGPWCYTTNTSWCFCEECQTEANELKGPCPFCSHCKDSKCRGSGAHCYYECPQFWFGDVCEACNSGRWGDRCEKQCPPGCDVMSGCHQNNGTCIACPTGAYGHYCNITCPEGCSSACQQTDGYCDGCKEFRWGDFCETLCPRGCKTSCNRTSAHCDSCKPGYLGERCKSSCSEGCDDAGCDQMTGECRCKPGWHSDTCSLKCSTSCLSACNQTTGNCNQCKSGLYGDSCNVTCSTGCASACERVNGTCEDCKPGRYGDFCNATCPDGCSLCTQQSGECVECDSGYFGDKQCEKCPDECAGCEPNPDVCPTECISTEVSKSCAPTGTGRGDETPSLPAIIGGAAGGLVVIIIIIVVVVVLVVRRRRTHDPIMKKTTAKNGMENSAYENEGFGDSHTDEPDTNMEMQDEVSSKPMIKVKPLVQTKPGKPKQKVNEVIQEDTQSLDDPDECLYENTSIPVQPLSKVVRVEDLKAHIDRMDGYEGYPDEYKKLNHGKTAPWNVAEQSDLENKNRYKNIMAYDHNRVVLTRINGDELSDYVNASYVPDYKKREKAYIASQGASKHNINDIWRMIWEIKIETIVMVTNVMENDKVKCLEYWPKLGESKTFGSIEVLLASEVERNDCRIRKIKATKNGDARQITQFHYQGWPDHGVPLSPQPLINLRHRVRDHTRGSKLPTLVHCSAGIGRTGTYIALDYLLDQAAHEGVVDIPACVNKLRESRINMVQNMSQYEFLHHALYHGITFGRTSVTTGKFGDHLKDILSNDKSKLINQFEKLQALSQQASRNGSAKNGPGKYSLTHVNIPNIPVRYMTGQIPTTKTAEDFWSTLRDQNISCIVVINGQGTKDWLPTPDSPMQFQNINVACSTKKSELFTEVLVDGGDSAYYNTSSYDQQPQGDEYMNIGDAKQIQTSVPRLKIFNLNGLSPSSMVKMYQTTNHVVPQKTTMLSLGVPRDVSLFITSCIVMGQAETQHEVDVYDTALNVKLDIPNAIHDVEEFELLHSTVGKFIHQENLA